MYLDPKFRVLTKFITPLAGIDTKLHLKVIWLEGMLTQNNLSRSSLVLKTKQNLWMTPCSGQILCRNASSRHAGFFLYAVNGIVLNPDKFQFCQDEVEFAGFMIGPTLVKPAPKILTNITEFPVPKNIADVRGWFGLVNQVAPLFANRAVMQPF